MLLLYDLIDKVSKDTFFRIVAIDDISNKNWNVWKGYQWQFVKGGTFENCEVISLCRKIIDDDFIIYVSALYDDWKGGCVYGFKHEK